MLVPRILRQQTYKCCRQSTLTRAGLTKDPDELGRPDFNTGPVQCTNCLTTVHFVSHRQLVDENAGLVIRLSRKFHSCAQVDHKGGLLQPHEDYRGTSENTRIFTENRQTFPKCKMV